MRRLAEEDNCPKGDPYIGGEEETFGRVRKGM